MLNIKRVIREIEHRADKKGIVFMGDIKDTSVYELIGRDTLSSHWGDSRFFMAQLEFYKENMADCYLEMNDYAADSWAEHYFLRLSRKYRHDKRFIFRFRTQVRFDGKSGANGGEYNTTATPIRSSIRQLGRYLFPYIWF